MGTPAEVLPKVDVGKVETLLPAIGLPTPKKTQILSTGAEYHVIILLNFEDGNDLILRVSGSHVPRTKTENEVATIAWLRQKTSIPVPEVKSFDSTTNNALGCEYTIQDKVPGESLDKVWSSLDEHAKLQVLDFVADVLRQLNAHHWHHICSLETSHDTVKPGPILDERYWEQRDIDRYFPGETTESLNPLGPYKSYTEYSVARLEKYIYCIQQHDSLDFMCGHLPQIENFIRKIRESEDPLNMDTKLCLAHRDLHMGNIMYDTGTNTVPGILDWEFSAVMPLQQGDVSRALLWDGCNDKESGARRRKLVEVMKQRHPDVLDDYNYSSEDQEEMQNVVDLLRAIVEVSPRGQRAEEKLNWRDQMLDIIRR